MNNSVFKYILLFLATIYVLSGISEIFLVKNGAEAVFLSVEKFVPHVAMFVLGLYFSKKD